LRPEPPGTRYPHPYFVRKFLVFISLRVGYRCKILITMKFPAKSSRIRSYVQLRPLRAASVPGRWFEERLLRIIVQQSWEIICTGTVVSLPGWGSSSPKSRNRDVGQPRRRSPFIHNEDMPVVNPSIVKCKSSLPGPQKRGTGGTLNLV